MKTPAPQPDETEIPLEALILQLLRERGEDKTICPSEVARALDPTNWRARMQEVRTEAARLAAAGVIVVLQRGRIVNPSEARGPIRLRHASVARKRR